jgi:hypothetical protein
MKVRDKGVIWEGENACVILVENLFVLEHDKSITNSSTEKLVATRL